MTLERGADLPSLNEPAPLLKLHPAAIDWTTFKTQMTIAALLALVATFAAYWQTLSIGFLPGDTAVVAAISAASGASWRSFADSFLKAIGSNPDYGRLALLSLIKDFSLWHSNASGYHLTNIGILAISAILVGQITAQICRRWGNRLGGAPAIWASLLFAVNPLNGAFAPIITARLDLMLQLYTLMVIFFYLRLRALREKGYLWLALGSLGLALLTSPAAMFIPVIVTAAEFLQIGQLQPASSGAPADASPARLSFLQRALLPGCFWLETCMLLTVGIAVPELIPLSRLDFNFSSWLINFTTARLWQNLLIPVNAAKPSLPILICLGLVGCVAVVSLLVRAASRAVSGRCLAWLAIWCALSTVPVSWLLLLPQNQALWNTGSYGPAAFIAQASAPLSIFLVLSLLPDLGATPRRIASATATVGVVALLLLTGIYTFILQANLQPLVMAGRQLKAMHAQLQARTTDHGKEVLIAALPAALSQASAVPPGQPPTAYAQSIIKSPFVLQPDNVSFKLVPGAAGDYVWPQHLLAATNRANTVTIAWDEADNRFVEISKPSGDANFDFYINEQTFKFLDITPPEALQESQNKLKVLTEHASAITPLRNGLRIMPGKHRITVWLPAVNLDPSQADVAALMMLYTSASGCHTCNNQQLKLTWQGQTGLHSSEQGQAVINDLSFNQYLVWLGRYRQWSLSSHISRIGFIFEPGDYYVDLGHVSFINHEKVMPRLALRINGKVTGIDETAAVGPTDKAEILFDSDLVPQAEAVKIIISAVDATFEPGNDEQLYKLAPLSGAEVSNQDYGQKRGVIILPPELFKQPGIHYVRAMALNSKGSQIGLPTEPLAIEVMH